MPKLPKITDMRSGERTPFPNVRHIMEDIESVSSLPLAALSKIERAQFTKILADWAKSLDAYGRQEIDRLRAQ